MKKRKLICGVGVNDADYVVQVKEVTEGRYKSGAKKAKVVWRCPYYTKWVSMLRRCYSAKYHASRPTYKGCTVCDEWLTFSNFRGWMITQEWEGKELDKDLLGRGSKVYSPNTCVFIPREVNTFITNNTGNNRQGYLIGATCSQPSGKFTSQCSGQKQHHIGMFDSELEAHFAWKKRKHELSCQLANSEYVTDERVKQILLHKYENYTILEDHIK